jgi:NADPH:quinone reductase-like Zn-dependent oxidoreductase/acyl transferase domain-containing protein
MEGMGSVVAVEGVEWGGSEERRAGVSSFGFSGTNAHVVVEHKRAEREAAEESGPMMVRVSGKSEAAVRNMAAAYGKWLVEEQTSGRALGEWSRKCRGTMTVVQRVRGASKREAKELLLRGASNVSGEEEKEENEEKEAEWAGCAMPTYAFDRKEFWVASGGRNQTTESGKDATWCGDRFEMDDGRVAYQVDVRQAGWYAEEDHVVYGVAVMPGAAHVCAVVEQSGREWEWGKAGVEMREVEIREAVITSGKKECVMQYVYEGREGRMKWEARQKQKEGWVVHARGECKEAAGGDKEETVGRVHERGMQEVGSKRWDELTGIRFGPSFRWMARAWSEKGRAEGELVAPAEWRQESKLRVPVELVDSMFQMSLLVNGGENGRERFMAPFAVGMVVVRGERFDKEEGAVAVAIEVNEESSKRMVVSVVAQQGEKGARVRVERLTLVEASQEAFLGAGRKEIGEDLMYEVAWKASERTTKAKKGSAETMKEAVMVVAMTREVARKLAEAVGDKAVGVDITSEEAVASVELRSGGQLVQAMAVRRGESGKMALRLSVAMWKRVVEVRGMRVYTVTERAIQVAGSEAVDPWARAMWAMGRCVSAESGEVLRGHVMIDMTMEDDGETWSRQLRREIVGGQDEEAVGREVALRRGGRLVGELRKARDLPVGSEYVLEFAERGAISKLRFGRRNEQGASELAEGEVEAAVEASALNFRDVLNVLGMYPGEAGLMGLEFAGRVKRSAAGSDMAEGVQVMGLGSNCFANVVRARRELVVEKPERVSMTEAASAPVVFCTAMAVMEEARLRSKTVLVHAAAGGVGAAASQVALRREGARRVFGTAGDRRKQEYARKWGAEPVLGSRSTEYGEEILEATGGAGVDYVLNSLTGGDFVERTMACMGEEGHWSEIGKRGIQESEEFASKKPQGRYHVYDLGDDMQEVPGKVQRMLRAVASGLESGVLEAVCERVYPLRKAKEAYQYMFE